MYTKIYVDACVNAMLLPSSAMSLHTNDRCKIYYIIYGKYNKWVHNVILLMY